MLGLILRVELPPESLLPLPAALQLEVEDDRQQGEEEGEGGGETDSHGEAQLQSLSDILPSTDYRVQSTLHCSYLQHTSGLRLNDRSREIFFL